MQNPVDLYYFQETRFFVWKIKNSDELQLPQSSTLFAEILHTFPTQYCLQKSMWDCFILFRSWVINKSVKNECVETRSF